VHFKHASSLGYLWRSQILARSLSHVPLGGGGAGDGGDGGVGVGGAGAGGLGLVPLQYALRAFGLQWILPAAVASLVHVRHSS
jgi:hypothetical protein